MTIRRIKPGESDRYRGLRLMSLKDSPGAFGTTYESALARSPESWVEQADTSASGSDRALFLAFRGDEAIGLAGLYRMESHPQVGELIQVWVKPDHRRDGIGVALVNAVFEWARTHEFQSVTAGIMAGNAGAMTFYEKYGFKIETGIILNCPGDAAVLMKEVK